MEYSEEVRRPKWALQCVAQDLGMDIADESFALAMDDRDPLARFRRQFEYPKMKDFSFVSKELVDPEDECIYLCGNSLGLKPKVADEYMAKALGDWGKMGVVSHTHGTLPAAACDQPGRAMTAKLVGANTEEVTLMNGLTVNINLLFVSFYRPTSERYKILIEAHAFPSDRYAVRSQLELHGYDPKECLLFLSPRKGEDLLRMDDIIRFIEDHGDDIALVWLSGVHYYTGQLFDMEKITQVGHNKGCTVGFDLAHAVCNVQLALHDWNVDFAAWCSYKYMNSGAGGLAGIFVHERHADRTAPQLLGWWSNRNETRFEMREDVDLAPGSESFRVSNPPPWLACLNMASLDIFAQTSMAEILSKQYLLTGYMETLITTVCGSSAAGCTGGVVVVIVTPSDPKQRGCQLSLSFSVPVAHIHEELQKRGIICDVRPPNVIRAAPVPLYNSFHDVYRFVKNLRVAMETSTESD